MNLNERFNKPQMVILCGGRGTRLEPITKDIPKSLIEVGGKPFIFHQLDLLQGMGFSSIILCCYHRGEMIRDAVGYFYEDLDILYSFEKDKPLGTAGAIKYALPLLDRHFFVMSGDSYLPDIDYEKMLDVFVLTDYKSIVMATYKNQDKFDKSNIKIKKGKIIKYDKNKKAKGLQHIDYGASLFDREIFKELGDNRFIDLSEVYQDFVEDGRLHSAEMESRFYEIGSLEGIRDLEEYLENRND